MDGDNEGGARTLSGTEICQDFFQESVTQQELNKMIPSRIDEIIHYLCIDLVSFQKEDQYPNGVVIFFIL